MVGDDDVGVVVVVDAQQSSYPDHPVDSSWSLIDRKLHAGVQRSKDVERIPFRFPGCTVIVKLDPGLGCPGAHRAPS